MGYIASMADDFPDGPVVKNLPSKAGDTGSVPGLGTKIPHAVQPKFKIKKKKKKKLRWHYMRKGLFYARTLNREL